MSVSSVPGRVSIAVDPTTPKKWSTAVTHHLRDPYHLSLPRTHKDSFEEGTCTGRLCQAAMWLHEVLVVMCLCFLPYEKSKVKSDLVGEMWNMQKHAITLSESILINYIDHGIFIIFCVFVVFCV